MKDRKLIVYAAVGLVAIVLLTKSAKSTAAAQAQLVKAKADAYQLPYDFGILDPTSWD